MNTTDLVPVFTGELNGQPVQLVNARHLYNFLEVARDFSTWIKKRMKDGGFIQNQDYLLTQTGEQLPSGTKYRIDYHLTLETAKHIGMMERNDKGHEVRRYFIDCERKAQAQAQATHPPALPAPVDDLPEELRAAIVRKATALAVESFEYIRAQLEQRIREQLPYCSPKELLQWLDDIGGPNAELVVLSAHELWEATSRIAVAQWSAHNALTAVHALEQRTGREWYGRRPED